MAATVNITTLLNGARRVIKHVAITGDAAGDVSAQELFSAAEVGLDSCIESISYQTVGTAAVLKWVATTPTLALALPTDTSGDSDWTLIGGIQSSAGTGKTGAITLTTVGLTTGDYMTAVINVRKS